MRHILPKDCVCGHSWDEHHHGCVLNPAFPSEDHDNGTCGGLKAEECEATRVNGEWLVDKETERCYCDLYEPLDIKKLHKRRANGSLIWGTK